MDFSNVRFTTEHEWVRFQEGSDEVTVGITDFAAGELGDIVYVELPAKGTEVRATESMGTIEAVKTVADLYAPVTGVVTDVNSSLEETPEVVNSNPYDSGWFVKIRMSDENERESLMTHDAYKELTGKS